MDILRNMADLEGILNNGISTFLSAFLKHTLTFFVDTAARNVGDYYEWSPQKGEVDNQIFPHFPLLRERVKYDKNCKKEENKSVHNICSKTYGKHKDLTPGLLIVTCACSKKVVYGYMLMLSGESPQMIFYLIMSRFPDNYNPHIKYDNSCKTKEYGLNREPRRFMEIQITNFTSITTLRAHKLSCQQSTHP